MLGRTLLIAATALAVGMPATAQERGTIEFGGFGTYSAFDDDLRVNNGWGAGIRVGAFIFPRLSVEFDIDEKGADRPAGLQSADIESFAARLTAVPIIAGPVSLLVGAGISHTDIQNDIDESDGFQGLVGLKVRLGSSAALRVDGVMDWNDDGIRNQTLKMGLSLYRHPGRTVTTVTAPAERPAQRADSVSAAETRRLRAAEARLKALRDSLAAADTLDRPSAEALATMAERIHFAHDQSNLDESARAILRSKVPVFRANPAMRIVIVGFASRPGTDPYNMALGMRRAESAKAYLVSQGIDASRIEIASRGEGELLLQGPGDAADAANRRGEFRIQLSEVKCNC